MWESVAVMASWLHGCTSAALYTKADKLGLIPLLMRLQKVVVEAEELPKSGAIPSGAPLWQQKEQLAEQIRKVSMLNAIRKHVTATAGGGA